MDDVHRATGTLFPVAPFDFAHSLAFLRRFGAQAAAPGEPGAVLVRALRTNGQTLVFELRSTGSIEKPRLSYTLYAAGPIPSGLQAAAAERIAFIYSLDDDLRPFYELAAKDLPFLPVIDQLYGYH